MRSLRVFYYSAKTRVEKPQLSTFSVHNQFLLSLLFQMSIHLFCRCCCFLFRVVFTNIYLVNYNPLRSIPDSFALQRLHPVSKTSEQCFRSSSSGVFSGVCQRALHFCDIKNKIWATHRVLWQFCEFCWFLFWFSPVSLSHFYRHRGSANQFVWMPGTEIQIN